MTVLATNTSTRVLKQLTIAIGWLSGSITGICAVLYSLGYLATSAHLYSLGIDTGRYLSKSRRRLRSNR